MPMVGFSVKKVKMERASDISAARSKEKYLPCLKDTDRKVEYFRKFKPGYLKYVGQVSAEAGNVNRGGGARSMAQLCPASC